MRVLIALIFFTITKVHAAACCGGSSGASAMILGDLNAQVQISQSQSSNIAQAKSGGNITSLQGKTKDIKNTTSISGAWLFSDPWQIGANFSMIKHLKAGLTKSEESWSSGDASISLGHETFPETTWSLYKPRGWTFIRLSLPTGRALQDSEKALATDANGDGRYKLHFGVALTKVIQSVDLFFTNEIGHHFQTTLGQQEYEGRLQFRSELGFGYNLNNWRLGIGQDLDFLQGEEIKLQKRAPTLVRHTFILSANYSLENSFILGVNYQDATWSGLNRHSLLAKTISLNLTKAWPL